MYGQQGQARGAGQVNDLAMPFCRPLISKAGHLAASVISDHAGRRPMATSTLKVNARDGRARTALLQLMHGELETPTALLYTRRGGALNMTPDVLASLGSASHNLYLDASQL